MSAAPNLAPFAAAQSRLGAAVQQRLSNAIATWQGGFEFGVLFDSEDEDYMPETVSAVRLTVSMCVANAPGIAEGEHGLVVDGQPYIVSSAVIPDAGGWATFSVMPGGA
ncbi:hypothetical protein [Polaromonas sp.]|uniref:hypothetical protein n=1 Tax=Polaromonas sp. TaxID=1869339 RepID=UPI00352A4376